MKRRITPTLTPAPTTAEINVLRAIAEHGTIAAAAAHLQLSSHTVDSHLDRLRHYTRRRYLPQIIAWAAKEGLLEGRDRE